MTCVTSEKCPDFVEKCPEKRDTGRDISAGDTEGTPFGGSPSPLSRLSRFECPDFCPVSSPAACGHRVEGT